MRNKAQASSLSEMLTGLITVGLVGLLVFFFITRGQNIQVKVEENEILRRKIILTNILLSSDKLAYSEDSTIHRGILDKEKLDNIQSNPYPLYSEISYPNSGYSIKIIDLDNKKEWIIGKDFKPAFQSPVAIRYSENDVHTGFLSIDFTEEFTVTPGMTTTITSGTTTTLGPYKTGIVTSENGQFMLNGKRYRFVGVNAFDPNGALGSATTQEQFYEKLKILAEQCGVSVIRLVLPYWGGDKIKMALESAKKLKQEDGIDVKFIIVLGDSAPMVHFGCIDGFYSNPNYPMNVYETNALQLITEINNKYAEQIFAWEILNEPGCGYCNDQLCCGGIGPCQKCDGDRNRCPSQLKDFLQDMSTKIKQKDPNHIVVVGLIGDTYGRYREPYTSQYMSWIQYMDAGSAHCYGDKYDDKCSIWPIDTLKVTKDEMNKPFILGEYGTDKAIADRDNKIRNVINTFFENGGDGLIYWDLRGMNWNSGDIECQILETKANELKS